ncbi:MAG: glycoside hydrolase family 172 protein [Phycisphaerales bacterium]
MFDKAVKTVLLLVSFLTIQCPTVLADDAIDNPYIVNVPIESRSITAENPTGEKGKGGMTASNIGVGRKGRALLNIDPGEKITLCEIKGPAVIRRMWVTLPSKKENLLGFVIRGYWDGQKTPSIEAPIGYFFGSAHGITKAYQSAVHSMTDTAGMSIYLQMPFLKKAKFTITNEGPEKNVPFYYQVDYTINEKLSNDIGRLHVSYHRENPTTLGEDFTILSKRTGMGRFMGCVLGINNADNKWWGEGEVKMYLDGDEKFPTICGTGTEDYIGHAWGFHNNAFMFGGMAFRDDKLYTLYRWHLPDPIYWKKDIRVTLQQIGAGGVQGGGYYNKQEDVTAAAFWYEPIPSAPLPEFADYKTRIAPGYTLAE